MRTHFLNQQTRLQLYTGRLLCNTQWAIVSANVSAINKYRSIKTLHA